MSEFVNVPVPENRVMEVYALLATEPAPQERDLSPEWSENDVKVAFAESSNQQKRFLLMMAEQPDTWLKSEDAYETLGFTAHQFAGMMGAFERRIKHKYGKSEWFFSVKVDPVTELGAYQMNGLKAQVVRGTSSS